jgi:hypothetical protein
MLILVGTAINQIRLSADRGEFQIRFGHYAPDGIWRQRHVARPGDVYNDGMSENISQTELSLLVYLHEHSGGAGERIGLDPKPIRRSLRLSMNQFIADAASLTARGFAGVRDLRPDANDVPSSKCSAIWLTGKGEDYLRWFRSVSRAAVVSST